MSHALLVGLSIVGAGAGATIFIMGLMFFVSGIQYVDKYDR